MCSSTCIACHCDDERNEETSYERNEGTVYIMPRGTPCKTKEAGTGARRGSRKRPTPADVQPPEPTAKRTRRTASTSRATRVPSDDNQPRPLTTADIPTIVSAVLEARDNQTSTGASATRDAHSSSDDPVATSGDPAAVSVNNGAPISPVQAPSEGTPEFGKFS